MGSFDTEGGLICPVDKMSVEAINQVLLENTGLTLDETEQIGMESFQYLPEYNAYYHSHGTPTTGEMYSSLPGSGRAVPSGSTTGTTSPAMTATGCA